MKAVLVICRNGMGQATPELQQRLLGIYLTMLLETRYLPVAVCFYGEGVKVVLEGSPLLDTLKRLEGEGVHLIVCQTCLNYYGVTEQVRVGIVGGMHDILEAQWKAEKVVTL